MAGFIWRNCLTTDPVAARDFYTRVFGWTVLSGGAGILLGVGDAVVCDLMRAPQGVASKWMPYLQVDDVPAAVRRATARGGRLLVGPIPIPGVGRFAILADPHEARIGVHDLTGAHDIPSHRGPGFPRWYELTTPDPEVAAGFYGELAGLRADPRFGVGPGGWRCYRADDDGPPICGMGSQPAGESDTPRWLPYFEVDDVDAALARVVDAGGRVSFGPVDAPDDGRAAVCVDPQGAAFGLIQP